MAYDYAEFTKGAPFWELQQQTPKFSPSHAALGPKAARSLWTEYGFVLHSLEKEERKGRLGDPYDANKRVELLSGLCESPVYADASALFACKINSSFPRRWGSCRT